MNDWRLIDQEEYLMNASLKRCKVFKNDDLWHEHCIFCFEKFTNKSSDCYQTVDEVYFICDTCYQDFKKIFKWRL